MIGTLPQPYQSLAMSSYSADIKILTGRHLRAAGTEITSRTSAAFCAIEAGSRCTIAGSLIRRRRTTAQLALIVIHIIAGEA